MIDIHCHILPAFDDGAENLPEALAMARAAASSGVSTVVMTPHCNIPDGDSIPFLSDELGERFDAFQNEVRLAGIPLTLLPGAEVFYTHEVPLLLRRGLLPRLARTDYLLVEFHFDSDPEDIQSGLDAVRAEGLTPVLAHPERYSAVQADPYLVGVWFHTGCVIQINKGSLLGRLGRNAYRTSHWLVERGLAHVVASDAHTATVRTPELESIFDLISRHYDPDYAALLLETNPRYILHNRPVLKAD